MGVAVLVQSWLDQSTEYENVHMKAALPGPIRFVHCHRGPWISLVRARP